MFKHRNGAAAALSVVSRFWWALSPEADSCPTEISDPILWLFWLKYVDSSGQPLHQLHKQLMRQLHCIQPILGLPWVTTSVAVLLIPGHLVAAHLSLEAKTYSTAHIYLAGIAMKHRLTSWVDLTDNFLWKKLKDPCTAVTTCCLLVLHWQTAVAGLWAVFSMHQLVRWSSPRLPSLQLLCAREVVGQGIRYRHVHQSLKRAGIKIKKDLTISIHGLKTDQQEKGT